MVFVWPIFFTALLMLYFTPSLFILPTWSFFLFENHFCSGFEFWVLVSFYLFCVLRLFGCESWVLGCSALCYLLDC